MYSSYNYFIDNLFFIHYHVHHYIIIIIQKESSQNIHKLSTQSSSVHCRMFLDTMSLMISLVPAHNTREGDIIIGHH